MPAFSWIFSNSPKVLTEGNIDNKQLAFIVQQSVRDALKKDTAILLEDIVNHPKFKLLMDKAFADKTDSWDPSILLTSEQWKAAIKDVVEEHNKQNYDQVT